MKQFKEDTIHHSQPRENVYLSSRSLDKRRSESRIRRNANSLLGQDIDQEGAWSVIPLWLESGLGMLVLVDALKIAVEKV